MRQDKKILKQLKREIAEKAAPQFEIRPIPWYLSSWMRVGAPAFCLAVVMGVIALQMHDRLHVPGDVPSAASNYSEDQPGSPYSAKAYVVPKDHTSSEANSYVDIVEEEDVEVIKSAVSEIAGVASTQNSSAGTLKAIEPADVEVKYTDEQIGNVTLYVYSGKDNAGPKVYYSAEDTEEVYEASPKTASNVFLMLVKNGLLGDLIDSSEDLAAVNFMLKYNIAQEKITLSSIEQDSRYWVLAYAYDESGKFLAEVYEIENKNGAFANVYNYPVYAAEGAPITYQTILYTDYTIVYGVVTDKSLAYCEVQDVSGNAKQRQLLAGAPYMAIAYKGVADIVFYNTDNAAAMTLAQLKAANVGIYEDMYGLLNPASPLTVTKQKLAESLAAIDADITAYEPYAEDTSIQAFVANAQFYKASLEELSTPLAQEDCDAQAIAAQIDQIMSQYSQFAKSGVWMQDIPFTYTVMPVSVYAPMEPYSSKIDTVEALADYISQLALSTQCDIPMGIGVSEDEQARTLRDLLLAYDEAFFETSSLLLVTLETPNASAVEVTAVKSDSLYVSPFIRQTQQANLPVEGESQSASTQPEQSGQPGHWLVAIEVQKGATSLRVQLD